MKRVSMVTRDELVAGWRSVMGGSSRLECRRILDEFAATTGYHRKHAVRLLRGGVREKLAQALPGARATTHRVRSALMVLWEAGDRICVLPAATQATGLPPRLTDLLLTLRMSLHLTVSIACEG